VEYSFANNHQCHSRQDRQARQFEEFQDRCAVKKKDIFISLIFILDKYQRHWILFKKISYKIAMKKFNCEKISIFTSQDVISLKPSLSYFTY